MVKSAPRSLPRAAAIACDDARRGRCAAPSGRDHAEVRARTRASQAPRIRRRRRRRGTRRRRSRAAPRPRPRASCGEVAGRSCRRPALRLYFMIEPCRPVRSRSSAKVSPAGPWRRASTAAISAWSSAVRRNAVIAGIGGEMRAVAGADDDRRDLRPVEHRAAGDGGDVGCRGGRRSGAARASSSWNSAQPPKSSMISLYLVSERFSKGGCGSGAPSQRSARKPPATVP